MSQPTLRYLKFLDMANGDSWSPESNEEARVLGGRIEHVEETQTLFYLDRQGKIFFCYMNVPQSTCTDGFTFPPQLPTAAKMDEEDVGDGVNVMFDSKARLLFSGAATARAHVILEVTKLDPTTQIEAKEPVETPAIPSRVGGMWQ